MNYIYTRSDCRRKRFFDKTRLSCTARGYNVKYGALFKICNRSGNTDYYIWLENLVSADFFYLII